MPLEVGTKGDALCYVQKRFRYVGIIPKYRWVIIDQNRLGSIGTWQCCVFD